MRIADTIRKNIHLINLSLIIGVLCLLTIKVKIDDVMLWNYLYGNDGVPSTPDGSYFLKQSKLILSHSISWLDYFQKNFLSVLISMAAKSNSIKDLLWAGNLLIPICAMLTALSIGFMSWYRSDMGLGVWLIGFFSMLTPIIRSRTGAGYIDTDILNIFFLYSITSSIYLQSKLTLYKYRLIASFFIGFLIFFFTWWYQHPGFILFFLMAIIFLNYQNDKSNVIKFIGIIFLINLPIVNLMNYWDSLIGFVDGYFLESKNQYLNFINTFETIGELKRIPFKDFPYILFNWPTQYYLFGWAFIIYSFIGLLIWLIKDKSRFIAYFPLLIFIPLMFFRSSRFSIYAVPLFWLGAYSAIFTTFMYFKISKLYVAVLSFALIATVNFMHYPISCIYMFSDKCLPYGNLMRFPTKEIDGATKFLENKAANYKDSVLLTWWDYGYHFKLHTNMSVIQDGGSQTSVATHLFSDSMFLKNDINAYKLYKSLANNFHYNDESITKDLKSNLKIKHIYLLVNLDLLNLARTIQSLSTVTENQIDPHAIAIKKFDNCKYQDKDSMDCNGSLLNLKTGLSNNKPVLNKIIYLSPKGKYLKTDKINDDGINTLINYSKDGSLERNNFMLPNSYLETSIFKLYFGFYNKKLYKKVFDDFPNSRIYELTI